MKVVCIRKFKSTGLQYELTYGKVYQCESKPKWSSNDTYYIRCDRGFISVYNKDSFISLEEYRNIQLNKIICE
jgi:hypothetical protein